MKEYYKITDGPFTRYYFAKSPEDAVRIYSENYFADSPIATKVLTDQGYPVVRLGDLKPGTYFHRTTLKNGELCEHSVVWCRGDYDRSTKKYCCYKFEDVNHSREFRREERVSIEFTF